MFSARALGLHRAMPQLVRGDLAVEALCAPQVVQHVVAGPAVEVLCVPLVVKPVAAGPAVEVLCVPLVVQPLVVAGPAVAVLWAPLVAMAAVSETLAVLLVIGGASCQNLTSQHPVSNPTSRAIWHGNVLSH